MRTKKSTFTLGRLDYLILIVLKDSQANNRIMAVTLKEIQEQVEVVQRSALWKHIHPMIQLGYINEGGMYGKQKTYYITNAGINITEGAELYEE